MKSASSLRQLCRLLPGLFLLAATALLSGCSEPAQPQPASPTPNAGAGAAGFAYARGRVDIEGGLIRLAASNDGLIRSVHVEEGDRVRAGQVLAVIDDREARLALAISTASLAEARATAQAAQTRLDAALREAARLRPLATAEAAPRREADQADDLVAQLRAEFATAQAAIVTAEARVGADEYQVDQRSIRAPLDGRIVKRTARPGDGVSTLNVTPLFVFAPDTPRIIRADLDERFVDRVKIGQTAEVIIDNTSETLRTLPARVLRVGEVFGLGTPTGEPGERVDQRVVECVLSIDDQTVRLGQRVLVKFAP
jgi:HlyD family secretion protein